MLKLIPEDALKDAKCETCREQAIYYDEEDLTFWCKEHWINKWYKNSYGREMEEDG